MNSKQIEREEDEIYERYASGDISQQEYNKEIKELTEYYRDALKEEAEMAARYAYNRVMDG